MGTLVNTTNQLSLKEKMALRKRAPALLLDLSGSMAGNKIYKLEEIYNSLKFRPPTFCFNTMAWKMDKFDTYCTGYTYMSKAIELAKSNGHTAAIMITDGDCTEADKVATLASVIGFDLKILYVGDNDPPEFMQQITSGRASKEDLCMPKELGEKLTLLLEPPKDGGIQL